MMETFILELSLAKVGLPHLSLRLTFLMRNGVSSMNHNLLLLISTLNSFVKVSHNFLAISLNREFVVSTSSIKDIIRHLKPKSTNGNNHICAIYVKFVGEVLVLHLAFFNADDFYPVKCTGTLSEFSEKKDRTQNVQHFDLLRL